MIIKKFKDVDTTLQGRVGGKAFNLAKLKSFGLNVPNGFVVVDYEDCVENNEAIVKMFDDLSLKMVAVRSSAICEDGAQTSFAGQFETILFVKKDNLIEAVQKCFWSNQNESAIFYAQENNIEKENTKVSVVVQTMIDSEISGVMFTQNPITEEDEILVECILGVGEQLVQGEVTPSQIRISKTDGVAISYLGEKIIREDKIAELFQNAKKKEKCFGCPQDIEFAVENNILYILQARPITTLS